MMIGHFTCLSRGLSVNVIIFYSDWLIPLQLTNVKYKYAVRYICKHEQVMRADLMAENLLCNNMNAFWKDVRSIHRSNVTLPCSIEGVSGAENIAELWRQHYTTLFNCVKSEPGKVEVVSSMDTGSITTNEVYQAIIQLKELKTGGLDQITAEHLKFASFRLVVLLAMCFTGFMIHGLLPESMLSVTLLPVIKDKAGKVGSLDNYRPIALASVVSKVLERIILDRLGVYLDTTDNQFGFKAHHSTDLCIYALKEVVDLYKRQNSTVIIGFIDASKAFDRVNHQKLFSKLRQRGIPNSILRISTYWYANQSMQIKWGNCVSDSFRVSNGVRQGSLLSPALFNVFMNELSEELSDCRTGCMLGNTTVNHYMYADDLVVFSPSSAGFQQLLNICSDYGIRYDVQYNTKKSVVMICRTKDHRDLNFPDLYLSGQVWNVCTTVKYLGHFINNEMSDDDDMYRQRRKLYAQANMLVRKFYMCSDEVKINLFRAYCTSFYTAPLWFKFKKESLCKLQVAYNDCMRILLKKTRWCSASDLFCKARVQSFPALMRNLMYKLICRLDNSRNTIIMLLTNPRLTEVRYQSSMRKYWHNCLF